MKEKWIVRVLSFLVMTMVLGGVPALAAPDTVSQEDLRWYAYDMAIFDGCVDQLLKADATEEITEAYDSLYEQMLELATLNQLAWIGCYSYVDSQWWEAACRYTEERCAEASEKYYSAVRTALCGTYGSALKAHLGEAADSFSQREMTKREKDLHRLETQLLLEYNQCRGQEAERPEESREKMGEIFLQLISLRNELATINGYTTYADYAYGELYNRDYTPEQAGQLSRQIKPLAGRYFRQIYSAASVLSRWDNGKVQDAETLLDDLGMYVGRISTDMVTALHYMQDNGLYLMDDRENMADMGFTAWLPSCEVPFLFIRLRGGMGDFATLIHEFGHFYDGYRNPNPQYLTTSGSYDLFEIHSTGLEALFYSWYDEIFGQQAPVARVACLNSLFASVVSGCIFDEFQQQAYTRNLTSVAELNELYREISLSYGAEPSADHVWMYVHHNFSSPFYYISYAASALAALELWQRAQLDESATRDSYMDIVAKGAYDLGYCELLKELNFPVFTNTVPMAAVNAYLRLEEMCSTVALDIEKTGQNICSARLGFS